MFEGLNNNVNFGYRETGGRVLAFDEGERLLLENLLVNGKKNGG